MTVKAWRLQRFFFFHKEHTLAFQTNLKTHSRDRPQAASVASSFTQRPFMTVTALAFIFFSFRRS